MRVPRNYDVQILHAVGIYVKCTLLSAGVCLLFSSQIIWEWGYWCFLASWAFSPTNEGTHFSHQITKSIWAITVWTEHNRKLPPAMRNVKLRAASGGFLENFHFRWMKTICVKAFYANCFHFFKFKKKKKKCRAWRFLFSNWWQTVPNGNPCPLKSISKYLQHYWATHCYERILV